VPNVLGYGPLPEETSKLLAECEAAAGEGTARRIVLMDREGHAIEHIEIRRAAAQVPDGPIDDEDARAITAPLRASPEPARLELATLPTAAPAPEIDAVEPSRFREGCPGGLAGATDADTPGRPGSAHRGDPCFTRGRSHVLRNPSP